MSGPALLLAALAATGSASAAGALLAATTAAAAVGGPLLGALLDRSPAPGRLLGIAVAAHGAALAVLGPVLGALPYGAAVLVAVGAGLLGPALSGGWAAQLPRIVAPDRLDRATAVDAMTFHLGSLAGPALAGAAAVQFGAVAGLVLAALLICTASSVTWGRARGSTGAVPGRPRPCPRRSGRALAQELGAGFRATCRSRPLAGALAVSTLCCAAEGLFVASLPLLGVRVFGAAPHGVLLLAATAVPALLANTLLVRRPRLLHPQRILTLAPLLLSAAMGLAALLEPATLLPAVILAGAAEGPLLAAVFTVRHRCAPPGLRVQVFTTGAGLKLAGYAGGAAVAGPLAAYSLAGALLAAATVHGAAAAIACLLPARGNSGATLVQGGRDLS